MVEQHLLLMSAGAQHSCGAVVCTIKAAAIGNVCTGHHHSCLGGCSLSSPTRPLTGACPELEVISVSPFPLALALDTLAALMQPASIHTWMCESASVRMPSVHMAEVSGHTKDIVPQCYMRRRIAASLACEAADLTLPLHVALNGQS